MLRHSVASAVSPLRWVNGKNDADPSPNGRDWRAAGLVSNVEDVGGADRHAPLQATARCRVVPFNKPGTGLSGPRGAAADTRMSVLTYLRQWTFSADAGI